MDTGTVVGVDVGYSAASRTTSFCRLDWDRLVVSFEFALVGVVETERRETLSSLISSSPVLGIALDGPLTRSLRLIRHYRSAEALLSTGVFQKRGKPGQTSVPVGQELHRHATQLANIALDSAEIADASHSDAIHQRRIVEAFPNMFLAALIDESNLPVLARNATDRYWELLVRSGRLETFIHAILPGRRPRQPLDTVTNHDHRASLVCALTALCVSSDRHVAAGDAEDGDIMLPPDEFWGKALGNVCAWPAAALRTNLPKVRTSPSNHPNHRNARITRARGAWD